jgi:hypothetical protein
LNGGAGLLTGFIHRVASEKKGLRKETCYNANLSFGWLTEVNGDEVLQKR